MGCKFKTVVLMGRSQAEGVVASLNTLIAYLQQREVKIILEQEAAQLLSRTDLPILSRDKLKSKCNLIIVVGGDGSLLGAGRAAAEQDLPVVGVNRGSLGFLTDIKPGELEDIGKILDGEYSEEQRFLLNSIVEKDGKQVTQHTALNDIVLLPSEMNRMIEFSVFINDRLVCHHRADGMIVATPTGSTAHALSAGGPILHPGLDAIVLLPLSPHTLSSRPIVVTGDSKIEIVMAKHCKAMANISCDGLELIAVPECGIIKIAKHASSMRLIHLASYDYFATLRSKLHWETK